MGRAVSTLSPSSTFVPGTLVQLKTDKRGALWMVKECDLRDTIKIVKNGKKETIYSTMYVTTGKLQKAVTQQ